MKPAFALIFGVALFLVAAPRGSAGPILSIAADSADPNNLAVGQVVQFDVNLSGLAAGAQLDYLAATVILPGGLFDAPTIPNPGAIIPDATGFLSDVALGNPDALYDAVFLAVTNTPISSNGTFFTFDATAQAPGSGNLTFDPISLAANDGSNNPITLDSGEPLSFDINGVATPEPASIVLFLTGLCAVGAGRLYQRKNASFTI